MEKEKAIKALMELRNALRSGLSEEERKDADRKEIEHGAETIVEMTNGMNEVSLLCILESFRKCNPDIIVEVSRFSKYLDGLLDIFGVDAVEEMLKIALPKMIENLSGKAKKIKEQDKIDSLLDKMNAGEPDPEKKKEKDIEKEFRDALKKAGIDFTVIDMSKDDEDD